MSFHWNLSSDEEDDGLDDLWKKAHEDQNKQQKANSDEDDENQDGALFNFDVPAALSVPNVAKLPPSTLNDFHQDEEESVDWEDAEGTDIFDEGEKILNPTSAATDIVISKKQPLRAVTVDLDSKPEAKSDNNKKKQRMSRKRYRHASLPENVQFLLDNLHKTHLLALTSHALFNSSQCSDELLLSVAHSLIPEVWINTMDPLDSESWVGPTLRQLKEFCSWFFDFVNNAEAQRQQTLRANMAAGAPALAGRNNRRRQSSVVKSERTVVYAAKSSSAKRVVDFCSYLASAHSENPQIMEECQSSPEWSSVDKAYVFIAMARSLGWRARYAMAIEPVKKDLDVDHPIFKNATINVFQAISTWNRPIKKPKTWKDKKEVILVDALEEPNKPPQKCSMKENVPPNGKDDGLLCSVGGDSLLVGWIEILCRDDGKERKGRRKQDTLSHVSKPKLRWVHVDPQLEVVDDPGHVESLLFELHQQNEYPQSQTNSRGLKKRNSQNGISFSKKKRSVAYVVAAEHYDGAGSRQQKRIADVTPRYASSMVDSLNLRGIIPKQQARALTDFGGQWWSKTITTLNAFFKGGVVRRDNKQVKNGSSSGLKDDGSPGKDSQQSGKSQKDAIDILSEDEQVDKNDENSADAMEEDAVERLEKDELARSVKSEALPTSKEKFKNHPLYVIPSVLKKTEILAPDAKKRVRGIFKGEIVYDRSDVSEALPEKKWLYRGRNVRKAELKKPVKRVKGRAKNSARGGANFRALASYGVGKENDGSAESEKKQLELASKPLDDGMEDLYAIWQTDDWGPPYVGPNDPIPVNDYKNVELELLNPGLAHIPEQGVAAVAKQLGIPYAPCLLGFEGHNGNRTPTIRGIVVHNHNAELLREASVEVISRSVEEEHEKRRKAVYSRWKRLLVGVLTKDRLEREYGDS